MYHKIHTDFILTPIQEILAEGISACKSIGDGIETQPLSEYILSSLFLKLTGAQEQKLKCICWEIATHDYDFRNDFIQGDLGLSGYSDYKSKNRIYSFLIERIDKQRGGEYKIDDGIKNRLIQDTQR